MLSRPASKHTSVNPQGHSLLNDQRILALHAFSHTPEYKNAYSSGVRCPTAAHTSPASIYTLPAFICSDKHRESISVVCIDMLVF